MHGSDKLMFYYTRLERIVHSKRFSLLGPFFNYEENKVLWITKTREWELRVNLTLHFFPVTRQDLTLDYDFQGIDKEPKATILLVTWMPCRWSPSATSGQTPSQRELHPPLTASPDNAWSGVNVVKLFFLRHFIARQNKLRCLPLESLLQAGHSIL